MRLIGSPAFRIDEGYAARFAGLWIDEDFAGSGIRPEREVSGVRRRVDEPGRRVECRMDVASSGAAAAGATTKAAASILVVFQSVGGHTGAVGRQHAVHLFQRVAQCDFSRSEPVWTLEEAVRQLRQVLLHSGYAEVEIDLVIVRRDIRIRDRPILA